MKTRYTGAAALIAALLLTHCGRTTVEVFDIGDYGGDSGDADTQTGDDTVATNKLPGVTIPHGIFSMGSPAGELCRGTFGFDETAHQVEITYDYAMLTTEVTQAQWLGTRGPLPWAQVVTCDTCPVVNVTWDEAADFCNALSAAEGRPACYACTNNTCSATSDILTCAGWRLPSEAEWERARRAGTTGSLYTTDIANCTTDAALVNLAWYQSTTPDAHPNVQPTATKQANPYGLYDMTGNAWEWCEDYERVNYSSAAVTDPLETTPSTSHMSRGGGYSDQAAEIRAAARDSNAANSRFDYLGFRCVRHL